MRKIELFGYRISAGGLEESTLQTLRYLQSKDRMRYVACANPHSIEKAEKDPLFRGALVNADILLPDGTGIQLAARVLGLPVREKVAGADFFHAMCRTLQQMGGARFFFLGSTPHVLARIVSRLEREFPAIQVCGVYSPPFKEVFSRTDVDHMVEAVNRGQPDVLWVGMTAPKQEKWIYENRDKLKVPVAAAIGAVFDFYAGTKVRSSQIWIALGLEWLPRFLREPRRLWRRNLQSTPLFLLRLLRERRRLECR